ncbi:MAG: class I SAM-dependent DNA methyltransferase, partial [Candidatus Promineofilum sp.]|nr:class I SAM-dependent DNA methyltransferase [Promineifilum sp.]
PPLSLLFAIPDHPWVSATDGAAVCIAMTVGAAGERDGTLQTVTAERPTESGEIEVTLATQTGRIHPDLTIGANVAGAVPLLANSRISNRGFELGGAGFIVSKEQAKALGLGTSPGIEAYIRRYLNGRDLTQISRDVLVIDLYGLTEIEVRQRFPEIYQWVFERVKPERDQNRSVTLREKWWLHRRLREDLRDMLAGLPRYIATVETSKHRFFVFLDAEILPDNMLVNIALDDAYFLGVLSSRVHVTWALAAGGTLEDRPRYNKTRCFETFPFPNPTSAQRERIRELGEQLDAHRKRQQAQHPRLTMTDMYNVLAKLRAGEPLTDADRRIHEQGLVSVLRQIHDELDAAVLEAYGWPSALSDDDILERLVALNVERAAEEARGVARWLRPEYQARDAAPAATQSTLLEERTAAASPAEAPPWPGELAAQATAVRAMLVALARPVTADEVAAAFAGKATKARREQVSELLQTLGALGQAREAGDGRWGEG